jgi:hypothetical protein
MTETVVSDRRYPLVVNNNVTTTTTVTNRETVVVENRQPVVILSGQMGPPGVRGASSLSGLEDVDLSSLQDKSILMYDSNSSKWKPSKNLENHLVNAGFF